MASWLGFSKYVGYDGFGLTRGFPLTSIAGVGLTQLVAEKVHTVTETTSDMTFAFQACWEKNVGIGAASTISALILDEDDNETAVLFDGDPTETIPNGDVIFAPTHFDVPLAAGSQIRIRTKLISTERVPVHAKNAVDIALGDKLMLASSGLDTFDLSNDTIIDDVTTHGYGVIAGIIQTVNPSIVAVGDSLTAGGYGFPNFTAQEFSDGKVGLLAANVGDIPVCRLPYGGETTGHWTGTVIGKKRLIPYGSHLFVALGTNDLTAGATAAQIRDGIIAIFAQKRAGQKTVVATIGPMTEGDLETPLNGSGPEAIRVTVNAMIRNGDTGADIVVDVAGAREEVADEAAWKMSPVQSNDGLHANAATDKALNSLGVITEGTFTWP